MLWSQSGGYGGHEGVSCDVQCSFLIHHVCSAAGSVTIRCKSVHKQRDQQLRLPGSVFCISRSITLANRQMQFVLCLVKHVCRHFPARVVELHAAAVQATEKGG